MSNRFALLGLVVATALGATGCASDDDDNEFIVSNRSSYVLEEVHIAEVDSPTWGPNLLPDVLFPGEDLVITNIACGTYDVLVVDEDGVECTLFDNDLCFEDTDRWVIDDFTLDICAFFPREAKTNETPAGTPAASAAL